MSRETGPKCRMCRRAGEKLFLKGERCFTEKCALTRKPYVPGGNSMFTPRPSTYGLQLREKQKAKRIYGLGETQFRNLVDRAGKIEGDKGLHLLQLLEMRLDNVVFRLGMAPSRAAARQAVIHGNFAVNDNKVAVGSHILSVGDKISIRTSTFNPIAVSALKTPSWLKKSGKGGEVFSIPSREIIDGGIKENLIVEFYSR